MSLANRNLAESESKYRHLTESIGEFIAAIDGDGKYTFLNPKAEQISGVSAQEAIGKTVIEIFGDNPGARLDNDKYFECISTKKEINYQNESFFHNQHHYFDVSIFPSGSGITVLSKDITERKQTEAYREIGREVIHTLNQSGNFQDSIEQVLAVLKKRTGFNAVGIRLCEGEDYPYVAQEGFPPDFLLKENTLVERTADNIIHRDENGRIMLAGTCGQVISGKTVPGNSFFTASGSFWINDSLLDTQPSPDQCFCRRNLCVYHNYASFALVPLRNKEEIIGLIHFADHRKDCFNIDTIEILEAIASYIGTALMRKLSEEELQAISKEQEIVLETIPTGLCILRDRVIEQCNPAMEAIFGFEPGTLAGRSVRSLYENDETFEEYGSLIYNEIKMQGRFDGEIAYMRQNGELFWARDIGVPIFPERSEMYTVFSFTDISKQIKDRDMLTLQKEELEATLGRIKRLEGIISICMYCKKIRNENSWEQLEKYITENSDAFFSHGICPECFEKESKSLLEG